VPNGIIGSSKAEENGSGLDHELLLKAVSAATWSTCDETLLVQSYEVPQPSVIAGGQLTLSSNWR